MPPSASLPSLLFYSDLTKATSFEGRKGVLMEGEKIAHFKILEKLGAGGHGRRLQGGGHEAQAHCGDHVPAAGSALGREELAARVRAFRDLSHFED